MAEADVDNKDPLSKWQLRGEVLELLPPFVKEARIKDWDGHYLRGADYYGNRWYASAEKRFKKLLEEALLFWKGPLEGPGSLVAFKQALEVGFPGKLLEEPIAIPLGYQELDCPFCGSKLRISFDGQEFSIGSAKPCPHPDGLISEWELNVPSGKIAVANDLRHWFPSDEDYDLNGLFGTHLTTMGYAKVGMAHGFVGNTCPNVYQDGEGFVIGSYMEELWDQKTDEEYANPEPCPWGESVANVCTDLWWYSIVDLEELERRVPHYTPEAAMKEVLERVTVVDVKPGVYKFRQEQGIDRDAGVVEYASFKWDRDPDPVVDYLQREKDKSSSATEYLIQSCLSYPSLYLDGDSEDKHRGVEMWNEYTPEQKVQALARAADSTMCVLGGGIEWHENGFPRGTISEEAQQLAAEYGEVPPFDFETRWYPLSEGYGGLCLGSGVVGTSSYTKNNPLVDLAPDFVKLGLNIAQNALKFGEKPSLNTDVWPPAYEVEFCRERMGTFAECYRGLRKRNPDLVFDEEFDAWMADEKVVSEHIANFDFGPVHPPKERWGDPPVTVKKGEYFEFDAMALENGSFCWHPKKMSGWASKENAQRYCLHILGDTQSPMGHLHMEDMSCRGPATVPLKIVGRVLRGTGEGHSSKHLVVAFDYGTEHMTSKEWAFRESDMEAVRQFDGTEEYVNLLETCKIEFIKTEAEFDKEKRTKKKGSKKKRTKKKATKKKATKKKATKKKATKKKATKKK